MSNRARRKRRAMRESATRKREGELGRLLSGAEKVGVFSIRARKRAYAQLKGVEERIDLRWSRAPWERP